jgi:nicotinate-nucleotide adenylyltransferase
MKIALFFGSFNPIHIGHLIIANHIVNNTDCDKVWLVVSPHNPLKEKAGLLNEFDRLHLVQLAVEDNEKLVACNEEFYLPKPSYTIDTLTHLQEKYPTYEFSLVMGSDNILNIDKWKNYELLLERYTIYIYNRPEYNSDNLKIKGDIRSSTYIRNNIKENKSIKYLLHPSVEKYILDYNLYKK